MATPGRVPGQPRAAYVRHWPEDTRLYQIVAANYPTFRELLEQQGRPLPAYVARVVMNFSSVAGWNMEFYACGAIAATARSWWHLAASGAASAPVAVPGEWQRALRCWSTRCSHNVPFVSGC